MMLENLYSARRNVAMPRGHTPRWATEYWIYEDDNELIEIQPYCGQEWRKVHKIILEYEATGESLTHGRPIPKGIFKMVYDQDGGCDPYYMSYKIVDGKVKWFED